MTYSGIFDETECKQELKRAKKYIKKQADIIFALEKEMSFEEILPLIIEKGFSRIPVYNDKMDQIDGNASSL